ncbi:MAG: methyltransferase domain-containing protein [Rhodospirillales bacterium]|nr:methyltransferase domain-containing protein [Rhodospirillales bacterium]
MERVHTTADADALMQKAAMLLEAGRPGAARPLLVAARRLGSGSPGLAQLSARLAIQDGTLDEARIELDEAVARAPDHAGLRVSRAEIRHRLGDLDGATRDAAEAVILNRADPVAKGLLGVLMLELGRASEAIACLTEAVEDAPADPTFREALAGAHAAAGDLDAALAVLQHGIAAVPANVALRNAAVLLCIRRRDFSQADRLSEAARGAGIADACTFGLRGHALSSLGRHAEAATAYAEALKLGPADPYVRHLAAAAGHVPGETRAPAAYLETVFDGYAERFETHLISLGYRVPGVIRRLLSAHPRIQEGETLGPVLDLGCGTGLLALVLGDLPVGPITGVDLSGRMLAQAAAKGLYATLRQDDVLTVLAEDGDRWPLILAGDVVCYFGALEELMQGVHARLEPGGWFVFSTEELLAHADGTLPGDGRWALLRQGRYVHHADYLAACAATAGFHTRVFERGVIRWEADMPVNGFFVVLERVRHDG